jgi:hypothetical protein
MPSETRSPSHATRADARIGESRRGHAARHIGKSGPQPASARRDGCNEPAVGENRQVIPDRR